MEQSAQTPYGEVSTPTASEDKRSRLANNDHLAAFDDISRDRAEPIVIPPPSIGLLRFPPRRGVVPGG
jgi:hypothetical protein